MSANLLIGIAALITGLGTIGAIYVNVINPRTKDANRIAAAAVQQSERQNDLDVLEATLVALRSNLADAQTEATQLRDDLREARKEIEKLRDETTIALANIATLSEHIRRYVPESIPFPRLRSVS